MSRVCISGHVTPGPNFCHVCGVALPKPPETRCAFCTRPVRRNMQARTSPAGMLCVMCYAAVSLGSMERLTWVGADLPPWVARGVR